MKQPIMLLMAMTAMLCGAKAQQMAVDAAGNRVARISFDREEVTMVYADQTTATVEAARVHREADTTSQPTDTTGPTAGIVSPGQYEPEAGAELYDVQGRRVAKAEQPGIYIERRGNQVRKIVKIK